jgi:hypothetical protein
VLCRVNGAGPWTAQEVRLPSSSVPTRSCCRWCAPPADVDLALDAVAGRCGLGILVETQAAVDCVDALARGRSRGSTSA